MTAELVIEATGEVVQQMTASEASTITDEISASLDSIAESYERVMPMIREAMTRQAWAALNYRSPGEYVSEEFGGALGRLGMEARRGVVQELAAAGMSTRAIAPVVGTSHMTVKNDLDAGVKPFTPEPEPEWRSPSELLSEPPKPAPPANVIGIDGKQYRRPEPRQETMQEATQRQIEQGWRDTCTRIAQESPVRTFPIASDALQGRRTNLSQKDRDELKAVAKDAVDLAARVVKILIGALR